MDYSSVEQLLTPASVKPTKTTSTAIYVVARNAGEGADRSSGPGDYQLTATETADITLIGKSYTHVVVVLNVGGVVDTSFYKAINRVAKDPKHGTAIDSLLLMSQAGQESGRALVQVLNGTVDPSGHLTDTWASRYAYYPAAATFAGNDKNTDTEQYGEGIYVGYRYFDSFYKAIKPSSPGSVVNYPFGYGLSYTTFRSTVIAVKANASKVTVQVKVTNTGKRSGKQVEQLYFSAPQSGLDKPYQELAGYGKTDELAPGASQILTIAYDTTQMSSFDVRNAAYVMDRGTYVVRVGDSSRSTHVAAKLSLPARVVTEKVDHEVNDQKPDSELSSSPKNFYRSATEAKQLAAAPRIALKARAFKTADHRSAHQQTVPVSATSPYFAIDGSLISTTTAYVDPAQDNWEGTGTPYVARTGESLQNVAPVPNATLYDVAKKKLTMTQFVAGLNLTQLSNIVEGTSVAGSTPSAIGAAGYTTAKYENLGVPGMTLSDGPAGLRITQQIATTPPTYQWTTAWPVGTLLAQTWDVTLVQQVAAAVGKEMVKYGATLWLAPGMNIHRDPLNGRNFEYYSEDPLIAGLTAAAATKGVQSNRGVGVTLKHYAENSQETQRNSTNSVVGERALREIELKGFEYAVKSAQPMAVMTSYNKINGTWASRNYDLVTNVLHDEWGFKGLVMTDWGGSHGAVNTMYAGNDLIMPGNTPSEIVNGIKKVTRPSTSRSACLHQVGVRLRQLLVHLLQLAERDFALSATGDQTVSTTVDATTDLSRVPLSGTSAADSTGKTVFTPNHKFTSVADAYAAVNDMLAPSNTALTAAQKAAITFTNVVHQTPGDDSTPVVAYTVVAKGSYPASYDMRLGDLQRSAKRILNVAMQSRPFMQLAALQGVPGITVGAYTGQFHHLTSHVAVAKGKVKKG